MPTEKQKTAIKNVVENRGNISKAMRDAGYAEKTAKNPKNLTESRGWQELVQEYLPDDLLVKVHKDGLENDDANTRHRYLDTAYKLKGSYAPEKKNLKITKLDEILDALED